MRGCVLCALCVHVLRCGALRSVRASAPFRALPYCAMLRCTVPCRAVPCPPYVACMAHVHTVCACVACVRAVCARMRARVHGVAMTVAGAISMT